MNCGLYPSGRPNVVKTSEILWCPPGLLKNCSNALEVRLDGGSLVSSRDGRDRLHDQGVDAAYVGEIEQMTSRPTAGKTTRSPDGTSAGDWILSVSCLPN